MQGVVILHCLGTIGHILRSTHVKHMQRLCFFTNIFNACLLEFVDMAMESQLNYN
jgi:hypothetical protein